MSTVQRKVYYDPYDPFVGFDVWDPLRDFPYGGMLVAPPPAPHLAFSNEATAPFVNPKIDWNETPEAHVFKADLSGLKGDEVKVEVEEGNILRLSGERKVEKEEKSDKWYRVERSSGKFLRRFRLPDDARADKMKAGMENGVLTVTVPKGEKKRTSKATHVS